MCYECRTPVTRGLAILFGLFSIASAIGGYLLAWMPIAGAALSFTAPVWAIAGLALGLRARRRDRREERSSRVSSGAAALSAAALLPACAVALTCGTFNVAVTVAGTAVTAVVGGAGVAAGGAGTVAVASAGSAASEWADESEPWCGSYTCMRAPSTSDGIALAGLVLLAIVSSLADDDDAAAPPRGDADPASDADPATSPAAP